MAKPTNEDTTPAAVYETHLELTWGVSKAVRPKYTRNCTDKAMPMSVRLVQSGVVNAVPSSASKAHEHWLMQTRSQAANVLDATWCCASSLLATSKCG